MPVLDELLTDGTRYVSAFANGPYTRSSIPAFRASQLLAYDQLDRTTTVASVLEESGVTTAAMGTQTGIGLADGEFDFGETIDLGRDEYHDRATVESSLADLVGQRLSSTAVSVSDRLQSMGATGVNARHRTAYRRLFEGTGFTDLGYTSAEAVPDRAIDWVETQASEPFFLWVHYMEAHRPYGSMTRTPPTSMDRSPKSVSSG